MGNDRDDKAQQTKNKAINSVMFALIPFAAVFTRLLAHDGELSRFIFTMAYVYAALLLVFGVLCFIPIATNCFSSKLKGIVSIIICIALSVFISSAFA